MPRPFQQLPYIPSLDLSQSLRRKSRNKSRSSIKTYSTANRIAVNMVINPRKRKVQPSWRETVAEANNHRNASLASAGGDLLTAAYQEYIKDNNLNSKGLMNLPGEVLQPRDIEITEISPEQLVKMLASRDLTAAEVTKAFLNRAVVAQIATNCITELLSDRARARATELDDYINKHGKPIGPLHGLPISVKEMIGMNGLGLNAAFVAWWTHIAPEDAHVLQILWDAGAVFYARTTQPQTMMHLETESNLYGISCNPYNANVSSGGSSGGEGALVGMRGSCLGVGSDIGGSIRNPAANCGIYGFKPTAFRIPTDGWCSIAAGADSIPGVIGPLSSSLEGIKLFMSTIIGAKPWLSEPALIPMPWNFETYSPTRPLKIAVMWHDEVVTPHPPITRALCELTAKLKSISNIEVVDWKPHLHSEAWAIISSLYFTDGGEETKAALAESGEPWMPLTSFILKENPCVKKLSPKKIYYWQEEREAYRKEYAKIWNETATGSGGSGMVDVILCPVGPGVAPSHNTAKYWSYTSQWNLLDYPAIAFPVSKVDKDKDTSNQGFSAMTDADAQNHKLYNAEAFDGLPISLQLVGRRFEDEKVLAILEHVTRVAELPFALFP